MIYSVSARLIENKAGEFLKRLTDGSIQAQEPDGASIVGAMEAARIDTDGLARWTETCYCATPLAHERATVFDRFFTEMATEPVDEHAGFEGGPLMDRLAALAEG
jgi:hypothetical protein